jgi:hypothetical protein
MVAGSSLCWLEWRTVGCRQEVLEFGRNDFQLGCAEAELVLSRTVIEWEQEIVKEKVKLCLDFSNFQVETLSAIRLEWFRMLLLWHQPNCQLFVGPLPSQVVIVSEGQSVV